MPLLSDRGQTPERLLGSSDADGWIGAVVGVGVDDVDGSEICANVGRGICT